MKTSLSSMLDEGPRAHRLEKGMLQSKKMIMITNRKSMQEKKPISLPQKKN